MPSRRTPETGDRKSDPSSTKGNVITSGSFQQDLVEFFAFISHPDRLNAPVQKDRRSQCMPTIVNRGSELAKLVQVRTDDRSHSVIWESMYRILQETHLVVNAISIGLYPDTPVRVSWRTCHFDCGLFITNVIPNSPRTRLIEGAPAPGARCSTVWECLWIKELSSPKSDRGMPHHPRSCGIQLPPFSRGVSPDLGHFRPDAVSSGFGKTAQTYLLLFTNMHGEKSDNGTSFCSVRNG